MPNLLEPHQATRTMPETLNPTPHNLALHWRHTRRLTLWLLLIWFAITFGVVFFARQLATLQLLGWPVSFYMAAQGAILVYVLIVAFYAWRMRRLDRQFNGHVDARQSGAQNG
jgi:putative solute:sodium symporter small subunit